MNFYIYKMIVYDILIFARKNIKNALIPSFINK